MDNGNGCCVSTNAEERIMVMAAVSLPVRKSGLWVRVDNGNGCCVSTGA